MSKTSGTVSTVSVWSISGQNASAWLREPPFPFPALDPPIADASLTSSSSSNDRRVSDSDKCWVRASGPLLASTVECDLAIDNDRHEPVALCVLELHDLTATPRQLPPSAGLLRVLFDCLVLVAVDTECGGFQKLPTCAADRCGYPAYVNRSAGHQLRGDRLKGLGLYHWFTPR